LPGDQPLQVGERIARGGKVGFRSGDFRADATEQVDLPARVGSQVVLVVVGELGR
jgi:hypothetical protein